MEGNHRRKGKIIDKPPHKASAVPLHVFEAVNIDTAYLLPGGNTFPIQILLGVTAQRPHRKTRLFQRHRRFIGQLGRGNVLGIKKLAQKQDVLLFPQSAHSFQFSVSAMDSGRFFTQ